MLVEFTYSKGFVKDIIRLRKRYNRIEDDVEALKAEMRQQEYRGALMPGYGAPLYKVRIANRSARRGKRGVFRAIYLRQDDSTFMFLHIYSKSDKNDVSASEISRMVRYIE